MVINIELKIENGITSESSETIKENLKYLENLREISISGNNENKVDNKIGDEGFKAILNNAKYLSNLEKLYLNGNKEKIENRL